MAADSMYYRMMGNTGLQVSVLSYGFWATYGVKERLSGDSGVKTAKELMRTAREAGINCFDHAERKNNSKPNDILNFVNRLNKGKEFDEVYLFCFPRSLGFGFNPLSIYFCYKNKLLSEIIFEVKNTFGDIHHYILTNVKRNGLKQKVNKKLFVSPFFDNKGYYELTSNYKKNKIIVEIKYYKNKKIQFYANLNAKETGFSNFEIIKNLLKFVIFPGKNWINIHLEALKLWTKKIKIYKKSKEKSLKFSKALKIK